MKKRKVARKKKASINKYVRCEHCGNVFKARIPMWIWRKGIRGNINCPVCGSSHVVLSNVKEYIEKRGLNKYEVATQEVVA